MKKLLYSLLIFAPFIGWGQVSVNQKHSSVAAPSGTSLTFTNVSFEAGKFYLIQIVAPVVETPALTQTTANFQLVEYIDFNTPSVTPEWRMVVWRFYATSSFTESITATYSAGVPNKIGNMIVISGLPTSVDNGASYIDELQNDMWEGMQDYETTWNSTSLIRLSFLGINTNPASITPGTNWTEIYDNGAGSLGNGNTGAAIIYAGNTGATLSATLPSGRYSGTIEIGIELPSRRIITIN
jgi:hypothetical protein